MSTGSAALATLADRPTAYFALTKPDVTFLVVITTLAGFWLGARGPLDLGLLATTVLATSLVAAGTSALNQYFERDVDARMRRTASRPLPLGVVRPREALGMGVAFAVLGVAWLLWRVNWLAAALAALTSILYLAIYTPLKKRTALATTIGAFPGALPPLIGWAAACGSLAGGAWILFAVLFLWQFPHFHAIAWMYREDYARAGIRMLPVVDPSGASSFRQILVTAAALVPVSLLPSVVGIAGIRYFFSALLIGMAFIQICLWADRTRSNRRAKWLMHATVVHIPLLLGIMGFDKIPR